MTNWELGKTTPRVGDIPRITRFLGYDPRPEPETLAARLVWHREGQGLTQAKFARKLGVDPSTLAKWERGERGPAERYVAQIRAIDAPRIFEAGD